MGKAIQCPSCGRKHRVTALPDAPTFHCEGCGQSLKVPGQFRPSVMASSRHIIPPKPAPRSDSTSVLPEAAAGATSAARSAPAAPRARRAPTGTRPPVGTTRGAGSQPVALPLRLLAWGGALVLGLVVTFWIARLSGWLSGDRLVDVFTGTGGMERYLRVLALAPVWALLTTGWLTLFLDGGRALARRRAAVRTDDRAPAPRRRFRRAPKAVGASDDELGGGSADGEGEEPRRKAARRTAS
jgi:hypothetical protein